MNRRRIAWPRGKVLGGTSSINGMVYIRGQRQDYDRWRSMGNIGWSYADVLPYFKRSEYKAEGANNYHGRWRSITSAPIHRNGNTLSVGPTPAACQSTPSACSWPVTTCLLEASATAAWAAITAAMASARSVMRAVYKEGWIDMAKLAGTLPPYGEKLSSMLTSQIKK